MASFPGEFVLMPRVAFGIAHDNVTANDNIEIRTSGLRRFNGRFSLQASMSSLPVVIVRERDQFYLQIGCRPQQQLIRTFSANSSDQSLDECRTMECMELI